MSDSKLFPQWQAYNLKSFDVKTLQVDSQILKANPLGDNHCRFNPLLLPQSTPIQELPVVFVLAGFSGNAPFYFNAKFNEMNAVQQIDLLHSQGLAPDAIYVFVDCLTLWGGSQFINSSAVGHYEDFIILELIPALQRELKIQLKPDTTAIVGGSSGGYGALHLASAYPEVFGHCFAIAPDSFFSASLLPDLYVALPYLEKYQTAKRILEELRIGKLTKQKNWHSLLNAFGMSACYSPAGHSVEFNYPLELKTGQIKSEIWQRFLDKDPVNFLPQRLKNLKCLKTIYLDVGNKDNFHLQYGTRQIAQNLKDLGLTVEYSEFDGNHFDIGERRSEVWKFLATLWRS